MDADFAISRVPYRLINYFLNLWLALAACIIKLFTDIIHPVGPLASLFAIVSHFLMAFTNTLAFYVMELITAVIGFKIQAPGGSIPNALFFVTYECAKQITSFDCTRGACR